MQLVTNVDSKDLHHHNQDHHQQQQQHHYQQQTENKSQETSSNSHHCDPNHHHHHLHQHHHHHYQNHHHHHHHVDHRPSLPLEGSVPDNNTLDSTAEVCQLNQLQNHHHQHHHHHHHYNRCLRSPLPPPPPLHHHHHHHHWSVTMTTVTLLVSLLACSLPVATSLENRDLKLAPPGQKVIMQPIDIRNNHSNNNNNINNNNNNNNKLTAIEFKSVSSLDNLEFKAVDLQRQQADRQGNVIIQQQQQQPKKEDWQPPSNNQGVPPPVQPSQEHQGKFENWANPPPPPPPPPQPSLGSEQKNVWSAADRQNAATGASASWRQSWSQDVLTQRQTQPVPDPWVDRESRKGVEWNYNANYYSLKASSDSRFLIRYSPPPTPGSPWPMPQTYKPSPVVLTVDPRELQFQVTVGQEKYNIPKLHGTQTKEGDDFDDERDYSSCSVVDFNVDRAMKNAFGGLWDKERSRVVADKWSSRHAKDKAKDGGRGASEDSEESMVKSFVIKVYKPCEEHPHLNMNESYSLMVTSTQVVLVSPEVWGLIRGLETFSQLVYQEERDPFKFLINMTTIVDFPRFKHRGILLDTSRHYLEVSTILENLESMSQNKYNVFHWHIVDDQSFPFKSYSYPNLTLQGAYDYDTHIYTHEDIELIIEYARLRGIRVIPEFDTPGHTFSWGFGQSHLLTPCHDLSGAFNGLYGPINPILRKNYNFLRNLFKEVMSVFKDKYLHLGGDEVPFDCWMSNPQIRKFMNKNVITDIKQILSFYARQLFSLISNNAKELKRDTGSIVWQEMFDNDVELPKDTIIQVWSGDSYDLERITKMGYATLFSTCWYLDYIQYGQDWDKYYLCEHISNLHLKNESLFYGGEVCLWAEYTDDSDILTRLWPRASAAAERLWSAKSVNNLYRAAPRLEMQRCRMMERGLQVGVLSGPSHCTKFRKKRAQRMADQEGSNASPNFPDLDKGDESYPQLENQDKRKLNRYGNSAEFNAKLKSHRRPNERFSNVGVVKQSDSFFGSDFFASSGSISLYVLVCFVFFLVFFFLKKKWVKLPVPTYFLTRNYRAFIVCLIFLTAVFILLQQARFFGKFPNSAPQSGRSG